MENKKKAINKIGEKLMSLGNKLANVKCTWIFYSPKAPSSIIK